MKRNLTLFVLLLGLTIQTRAESNESLDGLKFAEERVQGNLDDFSRTGNYEYLVNARKIASSLNPRGDKAILSPLDEGCLRLQLKVLLALDMARDKNFDPNARQNRPSLNVAMPVPDSNGVRLPSGADPASVQDPAARKAYEDAIAENNRRRDKMNREMGLSRGVDYAVLDTWIFVRGFDANSAARKSAMDIVEKTIADPGLRGRIQSENRPGL